jgi:hypothetical protein
MSQLHSASVGFRRVNMNHSKALLYTIPLILSEIIILITFTFFDPPKQVEELNEFQQVLCEQNSSAFFITQLVFDGKFSRDTASLFNPGLDTN